MNAEIARAVTDWFDDNKRDLPWRHTRDPYKIWVSEIMLQQTQAATVIPYYERFIADLPDVYALAAADTAHVYKLWEGLGYYRRAAHLQEAAKFIVSECGGYFPDSYEGLLKLQGVGNYTAAAIASIAFGQAKGVVDGNILRIISRLFMLEDNIALEKTKKAYGLIMDDMIRYAEPSAFNQAMMDLGATVCMPRNPNCEACPLKDMCKAFAEHAARVLPVNIKNRDQKKEDYMTAVLFCGDRYLLCKNKGGMLENLYGFVQFQETTPSAFEARFEKMFGAKVRLMAYAGDVRHVFTHRIWQMHVYLGRLSDDPAALKSGALYTVEELEQLPVSTAHLKVLKAARKALEKESV